MSIPSADETPVGQTPCHVLLRRLHGSAGRATMRATL